MTKCWTPIRDGLEHRSQFQDFRSKPHLGESKPLSILLPALLGIMENP